MSDIIKIIKIQNDLIAGHGVSDEDICFAEEQLHIKFNGEYKDYLKEFGLVAFDGRELTGIGKAKRTNVVNVTMELWEKSEKIPHSMYVVEEANIDGLIVLQDEKGIIYQLIFGNEPTALCKSFGEYISNY